MEEHQLDLLGSLCKAYIQRKKFIPVKNRNEIQRREIVKEIWTTEKFYNEQLIAIIDLFFKPMRQLAKESSETWGITEANITSIFSQIESIYNLSTIILDKITPRWIQWSTTQSIADIFIDMGPFLKVYKQFSENYTASIETLKSLKQNNQQMASWLKVREKDPKCRSLDLASLLIAPIQRAPKYILLLENLYKVTPSNHIDSPRCQQAAQLLKSIVQVVNDGIQEDTNRKKLMQLQSVFDLHTKFGLGALSITNLVEPHRKLIREGTLKKRSMRNQSVQTRLVYLCNDLFITITPLPKPIQSASINKVDKVIPLVTSSIIFDSDDDTSFYLVSPIKTHKFICESTQARAQWLMDIQNTTLNLIESKPLMKQQRDQWTIVHEDGKWKAVSQMTSVSEQQKSNVSSSIGENYLHEPKIKNGSYYLNNSRDGNLSPPTGRSKLNNSNQDNNSHRNNNAMSLNLEALSKSLEKDWVYGGIKNKPVSKSQFFGSPRQLPSSKQQPQDRLQTFKPPPPKPPSRISLLKNNNNNNNQNNYKNNVSNNNNNNNNYSNHVEENTIQEEHQQQHDDNTNYEYEYNGNDGEGVEEEYYDEYYQEHEGEYIEDSREYYQDHNNDNYHHQEEEHHHQQHEEEELIIPSKSNRTGRIFKTPIGALGDTVNNNDGDHDDSTTSGRSSGNGSSLSSISN